ncbi:LPS translocon maturation chaperone LptM [Ostreibacterium oceani]|uniref:Uncharacterized protein n=1 Tax=Ostreibacterium oceani TaxID=2654998 RepID=A0A6N7EXS2_9GAMM|nr:lipoprotein [Ostreibacterium oceani]MPV85927.1 hypothetical protein [Ostreibacterium oceani]
MNPFVTQHVSQHATQCATQRPKHCANKPSSRYCTHYFPYCWRVLYPVFVTALTPALTIALTLTLAGCGQKGPLTYQDTTAKPDQIDVFASIDKTSVDDEQRITPTIIQLNTLTINGTYTQLTQTTAKAWQTLLSDPALKATADTNLTGNNLTTNNPPTNRLTPAFSGLRYLVFSDDILSPELSAINMLVGQVENHPNSVDSLSIASGTYLRFRNLPSDYTSIPDTLSVARQYFADNPALIRIGKTDFMIETAEQIDLYIQVEKTLR